MAFGLQIAASLSKTSCLGRVCLQGIEGPQLRAETPLERKGWVTTKVTDEWQLYSTKEFSSRIIVRTWLHRPLYLSLMSTP